MATVWKVKPILVSWMDKGLTAGHAHVIFLGGFRSVIWQLNVEQAYYKWLVLYPAKLPLASHWKSLDHTTSFHLDVHFIQSCDDGGVCIPD